MKCFLGWEERKVRKHFYPKNALLLRVDPLLKKLPYNPYSICRKQGTVYGETPLTVFHDMFSKGGLLPSDCFMDLGCGRGRGVFFASLLWGCKSIGIDIVPLFCQEAKKIAETIFSSVSSPPSFLCGDLTALDWELQGSFFYFYSLCLSKEKLLSIVQKLEKTKPRSKIITVSAPLTELSSAFCLLSSWGAQFPWGETKLFLQEKQ